MAPMTRFRHGSARGQATTETILLTWIILMFWAAVYQVFLVNQSVFRSMTSVHSEMFQAAKQGNCYDDGDDKCKYNSSKTANVIWSLTNFPEIRIRTVHWFSDPTWGIADGLLVHSDAHAAKPDKGCSIPCKQTKMAVGTYWPIMGCAFWYDCLTDDEP